MEHTNYSRQMAKQFSESLERGLPEPARTVLSHFIDLAKASMKFILPDGGRIIDDPEFKAIDETVPLKLPHPFIAVEYSRDCFQHQDSEFSMQPKKALAFARERDDGIAISICAWDNDSQEWWPLPEAHIPLTGFIDRTDKQNGYARIALWTNGALPNSDYMDEVGALLDLLNALSCANVHAARSDARKQAKKAKRALPFDDYWLLEIDTGRTTISGPASGGTHRSPREHLRRGHIRRMQDGRKLWINATIVAAGRGAGVIRKDYAVHRSTRAA